MYAAPNRRTTHRLVRARRAHPVVDAGTRRVPRHVRARVGHGRAGHRAGIDPVELRIRNEPDASPRAACRSAAGTWSAACARAPAGSAGQRRDPRPGIRREGRWLIGTGVAASTYPGPAPPVPGDRHRHMTAGFVVEIAAADIGTGARTALTADRGRRPGRSADRVRVELGDSALPAASAGRRLDGHQLLGLGGGQGLRGHAQGRADRPRRHHRGRQRGRRLRPARVRRPVRRGRGSTR